MEDNEEGELERQVGKTLRSSDASRKVLVLIFSYPLRNHGRSLSRATTTVVFLTHALSSSVTNGLEGRAREKRRDCGGQH